MTANGVPSCGNLRKKQRPRIAGPSLQTSALPLGYGAERGVNSQAALGSASLIVATRGCLSPVVAKMVAAKNADGAHFLRREDFALPRRARCRPTFTAFAVVPRILAICALVKPHRLSLSILGSWPMSPT